MTNRSVSRRQFLAAAAIGAVAAPFISKRSFGASEPVKFEVLETKSFSYPGNCYYGWPTIGKLGKELFVVASGGREGHVCPFGRVEMFRSHDDGATWNYPEVIYDSPIDDRDAGICVTNKGSLLVTTFTSLAYVDMLMEEKSLREQGKGRPDVWSDGRFEKWMLAHERVSEEQRKSELGYWMFRSTDGGVSWSRRYPVPFTTPHGPIQLSDGSQLLIGNQFLNGTHCCGSCVSEDDGQTWNINGCVNPREGDSVSLYYEPHAVEAADGRIVAQIRNGNENNIGESLQTVSWDKGKTWSTPVSIGVWGLPSFLMKLADGRLLMTYGYRRQPLGVQARVSDDNGETWSEPALIYDQGKSSDLGYPSTVQLDDGSLITVWYELQEGWFAKLRMCRWSIS